MNEIWPEQPKPIINDYPAVWDLVIRDLQNTDAPHPEAKAALQLVIEDAKLRDAVGEKRYGTRLQPFNGRNALQDAYEELMDACVYLRQAFFEARDSCGLVIIPEVENRLKALANTYMVTIQQTIILRFVLKVLEKEKKDNNEQNSIIDTSNN